MDFRNICNTENFVVGERVKLPPPPLLCPASASRFTDEDDDGFSSSSGCSFGGDDQADASSPSNCHAWPLVEAIMSKTYARENPALPHRDSSTAVAHPQEATIYQLPAQLFPEYRPLPRQWNLVTLALVLAFLVLCSGPDISGNQHAGWRETTATRTTTSPERGCWFYWKMFLSHISVPALLLSLFLYMIVTVVLQEWLMVCYPSRISTQELAARYHLPSPLSRYGLPVDGTTTGVHWVESSSFLHSGANQQPTNTTTRTTTINKAAHLCFDAIYLNHGFGASSLSWLPTIAAFGNNQQSCSRLILGHDAPGLGFTDRPKWALEHYTFAHSASIGVSLLQSRLLQENQSPKKILLVGHSMGSLTTLHMALQLAKNDQIGELRLVLVAPALGLFDRLPRFLPLRPTVGGDGWWQWWLWQSLGQPILEYALRRLVGARNFWRTLLRWTVWGSAAKVMDSDVLRYQWAAITQNWEHGLICWAMSLFLCQSSSSDHVLLHTVLQQSKVRSVDVILGDRDCVIRPAMVKSFLAGFDNIRIVQMEGLGHDPFEEDADAFVETVQLMMEQQYLDEHELHETATEEW